ncbi:hypothetical protein MBRA1_003080 [Malassezia brasiliensis]|uniref:Uncharacterized protein n=1 Tax=Malassezia brasiliensis TaxID=1821822 RepID=A0AAF0IU00_9BASI|nr:hypothetical protein MBRA1_003080 [Malassezia brasiliensis]
MNLRPGSGGEPSGAALADLDLADLLPPSRFLSPSELARRDSLQRTWTGDPFAGGVDDEEMLSSDDLDDQSDEGDDETMQHLLAARRRLEGITLGEQCGSPIVLEPSSPFAEPRRNAPSAFYGRPGGKPRSQSNIETRHVGVLQQRRRNTNAAASHVSLPDMDLKLDLTNIPFPSYIDDERRRISTATDRFASPDWSQTGLRSARSETRSGNHTPNDARQPRIGSRSPVLALAQRAGDDSASPRDSESGFRFGRIPYDALEPGEWHWAVPQDADAAHAAQWTTPEINGPNAHEPSPTLLSSVQAEWSWALSPIPQPSMSPSPVEPNPAPNEPSFASLLPTSVQ